MIVRCPCCNETLEIKAKAGVFKAFKVGELEPLPPVTVDALEHTALRVAEADDHGIGRASWTAVRGEVWTVTVREGNPFAYTYTIPGIPPQRMEREVFEQTLKRARQ